MDEFRLFLPNDAASILGSVDDDGVLTFAIFAKEVSPIRGTEMFDLMMRAFGDRVRAVSGIWRQGSDDSRSINLDRVNERTAAGVSLEEAIRQTWTYTRAVRWGFTRVSLIVSEGTEGRYTRIDVRLEKSEGLQ